MNKVFSATLAALAASMATSAFAGGYVAPTPDVPPVYVAQKPAPAAKFTWTGPYIGLSAGRSDIEIKRSRTVETTETKVIPGATVPELVSEAYLDKKLVSKATTAEIDVAIPSQVIPVEIEGIVDVDAKVTGGEVTVELIDGQTVIPVPVERWVQGEPEIIEIKETTKEKVWVDYTGREDEIDPRLKPVCDGGVRCPVPVEGTGEWGSAGWQGEWKHEEKTKVVGTETVPGEWSKIDDVIKVPVTIPVGVDVTQTPVTVELDVVRGTQTVNVTIPGQTVKATVPVAAVYDYVPVPAVYRDVKLPDTVLTFTGFAAMTDRLASDADTYGIMAGYRHQLSNNVVLGIEGNYTKSSALWGQFEDETVRFDPKTVSVEGQIGYAFGKALPYVSAGVASVDGEFGYVIGAGLDYAMTDNLIVGAKITQAKVDDLNGWDFEQATTGINVKWKF